MSTVRDSAELLVKVIGAQGVADLRKRYAELKNEHGDVVAAFGRGEISQKEYDEQTKRTASGLKGLERVLGQVEAAQSRQAAETQKAAASASKRYATERAALESYASAAEKAASQRTAAQQKAGDQAIVIIAKQLAAEKKALAATVAESEKAAQAIAQATARTATITGKKAAASDRVLTQGFTTNSAGRNAEDRAHSEEMLALAIQHRAAMEDFAAGQARQATIAAELEGKEVLELGFHYDALADQIHHAGVTVAALPKAFAGWQSVIDSSHFEKSEQAIIRIGDQFVNTANKTNTAFARMDAGARSAAGGTRNWGQAMYVGSQAIEDVQYGINGTLNQIPMLTFALGGPAGLAAAFSVTAVASYQLYKHWGDITSSFESKRPFPQAANDLVGLNEQLDKTKTELKELQKLGSVTVSQANRVEELRRSERDIAEAIKAAETVKRLGEMKSKAQEDVGHAFEEALKESGAKDQLAILEKEIKSSVNPAVKQGYAKIVQALDHGNIEAYDSLVKLLQGQFGEGNKFARRLQELRPNVNRPTIDRFEEAAHEAKLRNEEAARQAGKELGKQGAELAEDFLHEMGDTARGDVTEAIGGRLRDILVRTRAQGSKGAKEMAYLTQAITDELKRLSPELGKFPAMLGSIAKKMARKFRLEVDDAIKELMQAEDLTKRDALCRLDQQRAERKQGQQEQLAGDEFGQFAGRQYRQQQRVNPGMPQLTPEMQKEMGQQIQANLKAMGLSPQEMVKIGKLLNDPATAHRVPGALNAMQQRGLDPAQAMRALPGFFDVLAKGGNVNRAANAVQNQAERAQRNAAQRAWVQATAVPRPRAPERPGRLPNTALDLSRDPERGRARNAERDRLIRAQTERDRARREAAAAAQNDSVNQMIEARQQRQDNTGLRSVAPTAAPAPGPEAANQIGEGAARVGAATIGALNEQRRDTVRLTNRLAAVETALREFKRIVPQVASRLDPSYPGNLPPGLC